MPKPTSKTPKQDGDDVPQHKRIAQGKNPPVTGPKTKP